jgi:hypothetical protein
MINQKILIISHFINLYLIFNLLELFWKYEVNYVNFNFNFNPFLLFIICYYLCINK